MYMAIFAGGFIIKKMVKQAFSLQNDDDGVQVFCIATESNSKSIRNKLKHIINIDMKICEEDCQRIVKESPRVFKQNNAVIATVQTTRAFEKARADCLKYVTNLILPFLVTISAVVYYVYSKKSLNEKAV